MANSVDPDQTALKEQSDQVQHCLFPDLKCSVILRIIGVMVSQRQSVASGTKG